MSEGNSHVSVVTNSPDARFSLSNGVYKLLVIYFLFPVFVINTLIPGPKKLGGNIQVENVRCPSKNALILQ